MSLVELMVATAIGVMVLGMASVFLVTSTRASTRSLTRVTLEEEATLAVNRLVSDIQQTVQSALSIHPSNGTTAPVCISIQEIMTPLPDGRQEFATSPTFYEWDGSTFSRRTIDSVPGKVSDTNPLPFPDAVLQQMLALPGKNPQILETGVTWFSIVPSGNAFLITLHAERHANTGLTTPESFTVSHSAALRNL